MLLCVYVLILRSYLLISYLLACLPPYLPLYLFVSSLTYLSTYLLTCLRIYLFIDYLFSC